MRILHVLDHSLPLHSGYTFRTRAILKAQEAMGLTVAGVTGARHPLEAPIPEGVDEETIEGLRFFRVADLPSAPPLVREWREVAALARRIEAAAKVFKPDMLHAHSPVLNALAAWIAARKLGLPLMYEIRAFWEDAAVGNGTGREGSPRYRATRALETWAVNRADAVAVICEGLRSDLVARGVTAEKIMVSPNGVDLGLFGDPPPADEALRRELGLEGADVIGFIGSFYDYEGIDDLIAAMPALVAERPAAHLLLVGGGPMADALKAQAAASPVADRIRFVGRVPHEQVERYYGLVDILCYPRKRMRLTELVTPLKPLEAMAQRRLVAASDIGGHRELIVDGETGTLFAPDDPAAIATALAGLLADRGSWEARREAGLRFVERERDWKLNVRRYLPVYQRMAQKRVKPGPMLAAGVEREDQGSPMLKPMIRTIDRWHFELPLALTLGAAAAFATIAAPPQLFGAQDGEIVTTLIQSAVAAIIALVATVIAYLAMRRPHVPTQVIFEDDDQEPEAPSVVAERLVRLRRADAHPDAPPRQPIRASRDLGEPFMDVADFPAPPPPLVDLVVPPAASIPDADYVEIDPPIAETAIEEPVTEPPVAEPVVEPMAEESAVEETIAAEPVIEAPTEPVVEATVEPVAAEEASPIEAFEPEPEPAPAPTRMPRQSLSSMMERLSAGLDRRNGEPLAPPPDAAVAEALSGPRDVKPELRNALDQLNRLAARRD